MKAKIQRSKTTEEVRPAKGNIRIDPTLELQVGASSDDCQRRKNPDDLRWSLTQGTIVAGADTYNHYLGGGMRFTNITIPKNAIIATAYLILRGSQATGGAACRTRISAENVDNPVTFANDAAAFDARWANRTSIRINWDNIPTWTKDVDYNSPEIKTVIQEIVNRAGWASGNAIVIFWEDYENRSTWAYENRRYAYSYNGSTTYAPKLYIEYTTVVAPTVTTQAVSDIGLD
ncbi:unnamed protein product [marine sediment metagenome]|uniref:Uncharacterized protein n=1 Tax=marine sediment metagenome TaxID=412755 RepID=X1MJN6_9ZZZZ